MDSLEKRIQELNQALQQVETPDHDALWAKIDRGTPRKPGRAKWFWGGSFLLLLSLSAALGYWYGAQKREPREPLHMAEQLPAPWQSKAGEYQRLVSAQEAHVQSLVSNPADFEQEMRELALLDSIQQHFINDFQSLPKDEKTALQYLHYYEQKIRILELIIKEIQLRKNETEKHRSVDI